MSDRIPYTYLEVEAILKDYDEQVPLKVIAESINRDFHDGKEVRKAKSICYAVLKANDNDDWLAKLEEKWLSTIPGITEEDNHEC